MIICWMGDSATLEPDKVEPSMCLKKNLLPNFAKEPKKAHFSDIDRSTDFRLFKVKDHKGQFKHYVLLFLGF